MSASPFSLTRFRLFFIGCWVALIADQAIVLYWFGLPWKEGLIDSLVSNGILIVICVVMMNTYRYYLPRRDRFLNLFIVCIVFSTIGILISKGLLNLTVDFYETAPDLLHRSMPIRFSIAFLILGCVTMISALWYNTAEQKENEARKADAQKLTKEAELLKLRQQLQPHFLFNSLNSINALIGMKPDEARKMVQQLSDFLRGTIRKEEHQLIPFAEELEYLKLYLEIEKVRFGYRLKTEFDISEEALVRKIPSLILQPLMENAIKFGLYGTTGEVTIGLRATITDNQLVVIIENPFDAEMQMPAGTGFGLESVKRRLYLLFGRNDLIEIKKTQESFTVIFKIPATNA